MLKNYDSTVKTVTFSKAILRRTTISVANLRNYHLPRFMNPHRLALPERSVFQGKKGRILERFSKLIKQSRGVQTVLATAVHEYTFSA